MCSNILVVWSAGHRVRIAVTAGPHAGSLSGRTGRHPGGISLEGAPGHYFLLLSSLCYRLCLGHTPGQATLGPCGEQKAFFDVLTSGPELASEVCLGISGPHGSLLGDWQDEANFNRFCNSSPWLIIQL
jgi:hypothetical protein